MKRLLAILGAVVLLSALAAPSFGADRPFNTSKLITTKIVPGLEKFDFAILGGLGQSGAKLAINQILKLTCEDGQSGTPATTVRMNCIDDTDYDSGKVSLGQAFSPDNEIAIAVDPEDPLHLLAGSNDYYYSFNLVTGARYAIVPTGFFTSWDGGATWLDGQIPVRTGNGAGDPSPAFDAKNDVALMAQLENVAGVGGFFVTQGDVSVSRSTDGGETWSPPVTVMMGKGAGIGPAARAVFYDKEWLTCDNNEFLPGNTTENPFFGRCYVTSTRFLNGILGSYAESPIYLSYSDDGGLTWSAPKEISGSDASCEYQETGGGTDCDEDQWSVPVVAPDGTLYVQFHNYQNEDEWEHDFDFDAQIMVVTSTDGGATFSDPVAAIQIEDGLSDMPFSVIRRQTIYGHQLRWGAPGNIAVDPTDSDHLAIVYSEREDANANAAGSKDGEFDDECFLTDAGGLFIGTAPNYDPCGAGTSDGTEIASVYSVESTDGGGTWGSRTLRSSGTEHAWFPWAGFLSDGTLVAAWDQDDAAPTADTFHHVYWDGSSYEALGAAEHLDVSTTHWAAQYVSGPDKWPGICGPAGYQDDPVGDPDVATEVGKDCNVFHGDYTGLAVSSGDDVYIVWTGLNALATAPQYDPFTMSAHDGYRQDAMFAWRDEGP